jgi:hypothetical protein
LRAYIETNKEVSMSHAFVGLSPSRSAGERFTLVKPFSVIIFWLLEQLLHDLTDDGTIYGLVSLAEGARLSESDCRLLGKRIREWMDLEGYEYLAWFIADDVEDIPARLLPKFVEEYLLAFERFLGCCSGFRVVDCAKPVGRQKGRGR